VTGAISACITIAQEGCDPNESIVFAGKVTLLGDTQIGSSTPPSLGANNIHVNYKFNNLDKNSYKLNIVNDYYLNSKI